MTKKEAFLQNGFSVRQSETIDRLLRQTGWKLLKVEARRMQRKCIMKSDTHKVWLHFKQLALLASVGLSIWFYNNDTDKYPTIEIEVNN